MTPFKILLAKKPKHEKAEFSETLAGHLSVVYHAADALCKCTLESAFRNMGLPNHRIDETSAAIRTAAILHDLGKANSHFQRMIQGRPGNYLQAMRHEIVSVLIVVMNQNLREWLLNGLNVSQENFILLSILGHHVKTDDLKCLRPRDGSGDWQLEIFTSHPDVMESLMLINKSSQPPRLDDAVIDLLDGTPGELAGWANETIQWWNRISYEDKLILEVIKGYLIASDVAGSAIPASGMSTREWIEKVLIRRCSRDDLSEIVAKRLQGHSPRVFQSSIANSRSRVTFANAGCGTGKTAAAYMWAANHADGRKLVFCYPTTGTASEGFRDYIVPSDILASATLIHSRAECDLAHILTDGADSQDNDIRFASLSLWDRALIVCTVDTVLGLLHNARRSIYSLPTFVQGAFIFDEIHMYDDRLFQTLVRFIEIFRETPILLMTASLPAHRLKLLQDSLVSMGQELSMISGPAELETLKRYSVKTTPLSGVPWEEVERGFNEGEKILIVTNTVKKAMKLADDCQHRGYSPLVYHSRFRYHDRLRHHNEIMNRFRSPDPFIAITTQVCEVSLDVSADMLVTDLAPVSSLIQRFGRVNRHVDLRFPVKNKPVFIMEPDSHLPYEKEELNAARVWLSELGLKILSQADLAEAFSKMLDEVCIPPIDFMWLDRGPLSGKDSTREAGYPSLPILLQEDVSECITERGIPKMSKITEFEIPMPVSSGIKKEYHTWKRLAYAFVPPRDKIDYSPERGGKWH